MMNIVYLSGLVDTTSDGKEFSFSRCDIDHMIEGLDDWVIRNIDVSD